MQNLHLNLYSSLNINYLLSSLNCNEYYSVLNHFKVDYVSFLSKNECLGNKESKYYLFQIKENLRNIPFAVKETHTMDHALKKYIFQKLPINFLKYYIKNNLPIEIHGFFPNHIHIFSDIYHFKIINRIPFSYFGTTKKFNYMRPAFFEVIKSNKKTLVISIPPGKDYIFHYASFIKYLFYSLKKKIKNFFIFRYPLAEIKISNLTKLDSNFIFENDIVIIGYVEEIRTKLEKDRIGVLINSYENEFFKSYRYYLKNNKILNFFGVKFSFWGDISSKLCYRICKLGAKEIIYIGKLGCLTKNEDLYYKIFVPSIYYIMNKHKILLSVSKSENRLLKKFPSLNTYGHLSVPTVLEETYIQRNVADQYAINSIDNEISQISYSINKYNLENKKNVSFSALHFSTDYLRKENEKDKYLKLNLSTNRTILALIKKQKILDKIYNIFFKYIND